MNHSCSFFNGPSPLEHHLDVSETDTDGSLQHEYLDGQPHFAADAPHFALHRQEHAQGLQKPTLCQQDITTSFLLRLDGQIYDVSNLAIPSDSAPPQKKKTMLKDPPPSSIVPPKTLDSSSSSGRNFSLYPRDSSKVMIDTHDNLDDLIRNWTTISLGEPSPLRREPPARRSSLHFSESSDHSRNSSHTRRSSAPTILSAAPSTGEEDSSYLSMTLDPTSGIPLMELGGPGGQKVPYFGADVTAQAIRDGNGMRTLCLGCNSPLLCMGTVEYVICPGCHTVSPVQIPQFNNTSGNSTMMMGDGTSNHSSGSGSHRMEQRSNHRGVGIGLRQPPLTPSTAIARAS